MTPAQEGALRRLQVWQDLSGACINMGRPPRGKWSAKARGRCPFLDTMVEEMGRGDSAADALLDLCAKLERSLQLIPPRLLVP